MAQKEDESHKISGLTPDLPREHHSKLQEHHSKPQYLCVEETKRLRSSSDPGGLHIRIGDLPEITVTGADHREGGWTEADDEMDTFLIPLSPRRRANTCPEDMFRCARGRPPTPPPTDLRVLRSAAGKRFSFSFNTRDVASVSFAHHKLGKVSEEKTDAQDKGGTVKYAECQNREFKVYSETQSSDEKFNSDTQDSRRFNENISTEDLNSRHQKTADDKCSDNNVEPKITSPLFNHKSDLVKERNRSPVDIFGKRESIEVMDRTQLDLVDDSATPSARSTSFPAKDLMERDNVYVHNLAESESRSKNHIESSPLQIRDSISNPPACTTASLTQQACPRQDGTADTEVHDPDRSTLAAGDQKVVLDSGAAPGDTGNPRENSSMSSTYTDSVREKLDIRSLAAC